MARYYSKVGYGVAIEKAPGVWQGVTERSYYGDVIRDYSNQLAGNKIEGDISLSSKFSILADAFAFENYSSIKYVEWMGAKWKVTAVEVQRPRLLLTVGGVYNGEQD